MQEFAWENSVAGESDDNHLIIEKMNTDLDRVVDRGTYVGFPKGLYHTFTTSHSEMMVVAVHDPFQKLDDEQILEHGHGFESTSTGRTEISLPVRIPLS